MFWSPYFQLSSGINLSPSVRTKTDERHKFVKATSALEVELLILTRALRTENAVVIIIIRHSNCTPQGQGRNGRADGRRTRKDVLRHTIDRVITIPKLRDNVASSRRGLRGRRRRRRTLYEIGTKTKEERRRAQSIHFWCHKRPNPTDQGPSPRSIAENRNSPEVRRLEL